VFWGDSRSGAGVFGSSGSETGVAGSSRSGDGVVGLSDSGDGVIGSSGSAVGVVGSSGSGTGVVGSGSGAGVFGATSDVVFTPPTGSGSVKAGVWGVSRRNYGVRGECGEGGQAGVFGFAGNWGAGVVGVSGNNAGVLGNTGGWPSVPLPAGFDWLAGVSGQTEQHPAVTGFSTNHFGFQGFSNNSSGVLGVAGGKGPPAPNLANIAGVNVAGVNGSSAKQPGIIGTSKFVGVYGYCGTPDAMNAAGNGVEGHSEGGTGVLGVAGAQGPVPALVNIAGVVGSSDQQTGIIGTSNQIGVYGFCGNADPTKSGIGVYGRADRAFPSNYAGAFEGNVSIDGALTVGGDLALLDSTVVAKVKNAVVPFPDGTHRVLHCMESPEHWFEDFGAAKLKEGRAAVRLDRDFGKVIRTPGYHVFLTPRGECRGLSVRRQSAKSFEVRELGGGRSNVAFSYRIVGRRKDIKGHQRFAKIDIKPLVFPAPRTPPRIPPKLKKPLAEMRRLAAPKAARTRRPTKVRADRQLSTLLARFRKQVGATPARRRRRRRGKRA
jgi:hypothetical protein